MGVGGLCSWLQAHFGSCFSSHSWQPGSAKEEGWERPDGLAVDLGGELHPLCMSATHELFFFQRLHERLDYVLNRLRPLCTVVLSLDGPGPAAKWAEQRRRRMRAGGGNRRNERLGIDTLQLTPGTLFMEQVREALCHYACSRLLAVPFLHDVRFVVSPATTPGEAELKLADVLCSSDGPSAGTRKHHTIVGDDSDLLLIGLCMASVRNLDVTIVRRSDKDSFTKFSTAAFFVRLRRSFPRDPPERIAVDFVFLTLLTGNDYLLRIHPKVKLDNLWRTYRALKGADQEEEEEDQSRPEFADRYLYDPVSHAIDPSFFSVFLLRNPSLFAQPQPAEEERDEEECEEPEPLLSDRISTPVRELSRPSAEEYIRGLAWNMRMYLDFRCPDYDYCYPSWDVPSPSALVARLKRMARTAPEHHDPDRRSATTAQGSERSAGWPVHSLPLLPYQFCVALMPAWGREYIPEALQKHYGEIEDTERGAFFMNPADLIKSRRMQAETHTAISPEESSFTQMEARTLSFSSHLFYERCGRRERIVVAEEGADRQPAKEEKKRTKRQRPVDEFGRDVEMRHRKHRKVASAEPSELKKKKKKTKGKEKAGDQDEGSQTAEKASVIAGEGQPRPAEGEARTMWDDGFSVETPLGMTRLAADQLALLRHGSLAAG